MITIAITNGYATLDELKTHLRLSGTADDARLESAIEAASRMIDNECRRVFYATTATKVFTAEAPDLLILPDDLISIEPNGLKTDEDADRTYERTWATTDYDLEPANGAPYFSIHTTPRGNYAFPTHRRGVQIAGSWGYAATAPEAIHKACLLLAGRYFKRADAPFGVLGTPELGFTRIPSRDSDVKQLIASYKRPEIAGV